MSLTMKEKQAVTRQLAIEYKRGSGSGFAFQHLRSVGRSSLPSWIGEHPPQSGDAQNACSAASHNHAA